MTRRWGWRCGGRCTPKVIFRPLALETWSACHGPVECEAGEAWWERLAASGFDAGLPAVVASTGVSMCLAREAIAATLRQVAALAPGSALVMSFLLPMEMTDPELRPAMERAAEG